MDDLDMLVDSLGDGVEEVLPPLSAADIAPEPLGPGGDALASELQLGPCAICLQSHEDSQHSNAVCQRK